MFSLSICRVLFFSGKSLDCTGGRQNTFLLLFIGSAGRSFALNHDLFISFPILQSFFTILYVFFYIEFDIFDFLGSGSLNTICLLIALLLDVLVPYACSISLPASVFGFSFVLGSQWWQKSGNLVLSLFSSVD